MNLIGLTGGIGSGKTIVSGMFRTLGIPVYDSDTRAKELMNTREDIRSQLLDLFGEKAYIEDRTLNRPWIATHVFTDPSLLHQLNAIIHPAVFADLKIWAAEEFQLAAPYLIQESAILFEENLLHRLTAVIVVVAPEDIRINRVIKRDNTTREQVLLRMKNQWPDEKKFPFSDYIIYNDGERPLVRQVMDIDQMIRSKI